MLLRRQHGHWFVLGDRGGEPAERLLDVFEVAGGPFVQRPSRGPAHPSARVGGPLRRREQAFRCPGRACGGSSCRRRHHCHHHECSAIDRLCASLRGRLLMLLRRSALTGSKPHVSPAKLPCSPIMHAWKYLEGKYRVKRPTAVGRRQLRRLGP